VSTSSHAGWVLPESRVRGAATSVAAVERWRRALWMATPFFTGAVVMAQELVAFRLYAPYFGYSIYVWGSMISVVMAALALGYAIGGWAADRSDGDVPLYGTVLGSAIYQVVILYVVSSLLRFFADMDESVGTALASLIVFGPPMTAMAMACPYLIRLQSRAGGVGLAAGRVYGVSTVGSIAGILGTSFYLVPHFGTHKTLEAICVLSAVTGAAGLALHFRPALFGVVAVLLLLMFAPLSNWRGGTVWAAESAYNLVRVVRSGDWLLLKLNDGGGVHTMRNRRSEFTGHYYDDFALGPLLSPAKHVLVLGMGGGGSIAATRMAAPQVDVDAVEIDAKVVEASQRFFGVDASDKKLHVYVADARPWLARSRSSYDLVHVDLYQGGPYIPFYLMTVEFFEMVRGHMSQQGVLMMNLFDISPTQELLTPTVATLRRVFPSVEVLSVGHGNRMLLAFAQQTSASEIRARLGSFRGRVAIRDLARRAASQIADFGVAEGTAVFTDDWAPVEEITRRMLRGE